MAVVKKWVPSRSWESEKVDLYNRISRSSRCVDVWLDDDGDWVLPLGSVRSLGSSVFFCQSYFSGTSEVFPHVINVIGDDGNAVFFI